MPSDQDDGTMPRLSASVPTSQKTALDHLAHTRSSPGNRVYVSDLVREAIEEYLKRVDDLPPEARDALDDDLLSNGGSS